MKKILNFFESALDVSINDLICRRECVAYEDEVAVMDLGAAPKQCSLPIRLDAMMMCLCLSGTANIKIDLQSYEVTPNCLFVLSPKNFLSEYVSTPDFRAKAVVCSRQILELILPKLTEFLPLMMNHPISTMAVLEVQDSRNLQDYFNLLASRITMKETPYKKQKVTSILQSFFFEIIEIQHKKEGQTSLKKSRKEQIMARFIISVSENFREHREVAFYANELCITPKHLSSVVKEISGRPAGDWIDQYVIMEAKVLLRTTDHTVQQISLLLNFPNQSFFGKYFKHIAGMSPSAYRNSMN